MINSFKLDLVELLLCMIWKRRDGSDVVGRKEGKNNERSDLWRYCSCKNFGPEHHLYIVVIVVLLLLVILIWITGMYGR